MKECETGQCTIETPRQSKSSSCGWSGCRCGCTCSDESKADEFLDLATAAHHELLKQKMKDAFEAKIGKKMDKVADLVVDTALVYMKDAMVEQQTQEKFEDKLMEIFHGN